MPFAEYPKAMYRDGWENLSSYRAVKDAKEEEAARAEGYKTLPEFPHPDNPPVAAPVVDAPVASGQAMSAAAYNDAMRQHMGEVRASLQPPKPDRFAAARAAKAAKRASP